MFIGLFILIGPGHLIGIWVDGNQRIDTITKHVQKRLDYKFNSLSHIQ